ncbi:MAG: shikimate dehydrogenase [Ilumatobacter fluminis]|uniref:shikimate dehydrogenase n=1 Tax=Ilumatobacter fluminis TaxID=467091 RepID=UPI0032F09AD4
MALPRLAAVIGAPVRHSLSPVMHNAVFAESGLEWSFTRFEVVPGGAKAAIDAMAVLGIGGYAVTMPHKQQAFECVDEVDPAAEALGAVNTVVLRDDGSTYGASTDGNGFVESLLAEGVAVADRRVAVIGAGGAARSIVNALGRVGAADIVILNRTRASAESAAELAEAARAGTFDDVADADVLVNATSVGMGTDDLPIDAGLLRPDMAVADIVYHPLETALLRAARDVGATTVDGLGMLAHQAVLQQVIWTGQRPDPATLRRAAEHELASR